MQPNRRPAHRWTQLPGRLGPLFVLVLYVSLAAVYTRPLLSQSSTRIANDPYDPILNASILWWNATVVPFSQAWWTPPHFYPSTGVAALTENLAGIGLVSSPVQWLTGNPLLAYNIALFVTWPLSAFAAYLLVLALARRHDAAFIAGLAFGFAPYRVGQVAHIQVLSAYCFPLALLGLHLYLGDRRVRWLALFAGTWLIQSLTNGYFMLFGAVIVALWLLYFCSRRDTLPALPAMLGTWAAASLPLVPVFLKYREIQGRFGLSRTMHEISAFSAEPLAWLQASQAIAAWSPILNDVNPELNLFPGLAPVALLVLAAVAFAFRGGESRAGSSGQAGRTRTLARRLVWRLSAVACAAGLAATVATLLLGPWRVSVGGVTVRASTLDRPLFLTLAAASLLAFLSSRARETLGRRSAIVFYAAATLAVVAFCMGPQIRLGRRVLMDPAPYSLLMLLPGFGGLRVPARFWMLGAMCMAVAAGIAFARLAPRSPLPRLAAFAGTTTVLVLDCWTAGIAMALPPEHWPAAEPAGRTGAVLELPLGPSWDAAATFRAVAHRRRVVNGVSGYDPPHYAILQAGLNSRDPEALLALASLGPMDAVVNSEADSGGELEAYVRGIRGVSRVSSDGARTVYSLPRVPGRTVRLGARIPVVRYHASVGEPELRFALDDDIETAWHTRPQNPGQWIVLDLGVTRSVGGLVISLGDGGLEFPRRLAIDLSADGASWDAAWEGGTLGQALLAAMAAPREIPMAFQLPAADARFVRLRQLATDPATWTIAELRVHAPAAR
ncbi:MAG: discoidin domain-containing protein [Vicinamibacterales bacterium]